MYELPTIPFTDADWSRIRRDHEAWWRHELDRPLVIAAIRERERAIKGPPHFLTNCPRDQPAEEIVASFAASRSNWHWAGDAYPCWFINFGPGIFAGPLGAHVRTDPHTVWFEPREGVTIDNLDIRFDRDDTWWRRIVDLTEAAARMIGQRVQISYTDLGGNLDILASLVGSEALLMATIERPDAVDAAVARITSLWLEAHRELDAIIAPHCPGRQAWAPVWAPGSMYMMQCDFAYMISPEMFGRFVMPDLEACCEAIEYPFYHLDGIGQLPHLDQLLSLDKLRGIQWVPGAGQKPPPEWLDVLMRIRDAGKLIQIFGTAEQCLTMCKEIGGKGMILKVGELNSPEEADAFCEEIAAMH